MNLNDVRTIVQAMEERTSAQPLLLPGTISSIAGRGIADVQMDSDPDGAQVEVSLLFSDASVGDRIMVLFEPPRGVFGIGPIGRTVGAGQIVSYANDSVQTFPYVFGNTVVVSYGTEAIQWKAGRYYDLRLVAVINLAAGDTDIVAVNGNLYVPGLPVLNRTLADLSSTWATLDGSALGISGGTLIVSGMFLPSENWSEVLEVGITVDTGGIGGDIDLTWEVSVCDMGPVPIPQF